MDRNKAKTKRAKARAFRVRKKIVGTAEKPRLSVFRSLKHIYVQLIDDINGVTLGSASTNSKTVRSQISNGGNVDAAKTIGTQIATSALEKGITEVAFDRGSYKFHGRVKALAQAAREKGLKF